MDFKKLFISNKAVSPVIGVVLMVAITVILAAAIGSTVFGQGTARSAPQANLDIRAGDIYVDGGNGADTAASVKIEHLGGDSINFKTDGTTKIMESVDVLSVGDVKDLRLIEEDNNADGEGPYLMEVIRGSIVNIKIIDLKTNQLICDKTVRF